MKALLEKLGDDETTQQFAEKLVSKLVDKLSSTETTETKDTKDTKETQESDDSDDADMKALLDKLGGDATTQQFADKFVKRLVDRLSSTEMMEEPETKKTEELDAEPVDEPNRWFALCTPGVLAGASLLGVAMAFVVSFLMAIVERKRRPMLLPSTVNEALLG